MDNGIDKEYNRRKEGTNSPHFRRWGLYKLLGREERGG